MAAENIVGSGLKSQVDAKFEEHSATMAFLRKADSFMITWKVPQRVHCLLYKLFFYANSTDQVVQLARQCEKAAGHRTRARVGGRRMQKTGNQIDRR